MNSVLLSKPSAPPPVATGSASAREIIAGGNVVTYFQPIFSAKQQSVVGVEALSRGIHPSTFDLIPPGQLFQMAAAEHLGRELEQLCRDTAISTFASLGNVDEHLLLFLNVDPAALGATTGAPPTKSEGGLLFLNIDTSLGETDPVAESLVHNVQRLGLDPSRIAVEILESKFDDLERLKRLLVTLRERGFLLVLDDVGAGHSNLDRIPLIRPDVIKIDRSLIKQIDTDYHKQETFKSLAQLARKIGALVVAEGVETKGEALASLELGADMLQGFYLARPQSPDVLAENMAAGAVALLAQQYKQHMVQKINDRKLQHRRYNIVLNTILCELSRADVAQFDEVLRTTIEHYPQVECLYVLNEAGVQVSDTVCYPHLPRKNNRLMFRPALKGADHSLKEFYYVLLDVELQKYTTDPYVSLASGNVCRTISTCFRDANNNKMYILCIDVLVE